MAKLKMLASAKAGADWNLWSDDGEHTWPINAIQTILLQEIRDELKQLNALLHCRNFVGIPRQLEPLAKMARRANTNAAKRRKAKQ